MENCKKLQSFREIRNQFSQMQFLNSRRPLMMKAYCQDCGCSTSAVQIRQRLWEPDRAHPAAIPSEELKVEAVDQKKQMNLPVEDFRPKGTHTQTHTHISAHTTHTTHRHTVLHTDVHSHTHKHTDTLDTQKTMHAQTVTTTLAPI